MYYLIFLIRSLFLSVHQSKEKIYDLNNFSDVDNELKVFSNLIVSFVKEILYIKAPPSNEVM